MRHHHQRITAAIATVVATAVLAPAASAAITPSVTLTQTGTQAGSPSDVTLDLKFAPTGSDSPKDLTVALPPGLLANASINGGACLTSTTAGAPCQVGSGTVTASPIVLGIPTGLPISLPVSFYLVAPPNPADLAGLLAVAFPGTPLATNLGSPADVIVRPSGDPAGVGLTERFSNLPNTFSGLSIGVTELKSTFTGLRLPATCPTPVASVAVTADSYSDPAGKTASPAPLTVTGCSALPFAPQFSVSATRDIADSGAQVVTDIRQKANEAPSRTVSLTLPPTVLAPNAAAVISDGLLCTDPGFAGCKVIGTASSTSPLYPTPLAGQDYLTGSLTAPAITIRFPAPFALTLGGPVTLATGTTTFTNLPDIPLTDLKVTLAGGSAAAFAATCNPAVGTATSALTTQNGDRSAGVSAPFTVANCPPGSNGSGGPGPGSGGPGSGGGTPGGGAKAKAGQPTLSAGRITGLGHRRPELRFTATAGRGAPRLSVLTLGLPPGLSVIRHRHGRRLSIRGVSLRGASAAAITVSHGPLVIRLRRAASRVTVTLRSSTMRESAGLKRQARRHRIHRLTLGVLARDAARHTSRLKLIITHIRL
ncbi:MAG: hypothetical protein M3Y09_04265 [Actinomycetota bacterium]|nr:hypothetical protein [Actinomycetota bacterium]